MGTTFPARRYRTGYTPRKNQYREIPADVPTPAAEPYYVRSGWQPLTHAHSHLRIRFVLLPLSRYLYEGSVHFPATRDCQNKAYFVPTHEQ